MTSSSETTCGSAITVVFGLSSQQYFFDREDRLIGVVETSDSGPLCGEGDRGPQYGKLCELQGSPVDLCSSP